MGAQGPHKQISFIIEGQKAPKITVKGAQGSKENRKRSTRL
jgi:hypothetical protein